MRVHDIGFGAALLALGGCASGYFVPSDGRYHIELASRMGVEERGERVVAEYYDYEARMTISSVTTDIAHIDDYIAATFDPTTIKAGERYDTMVGALPAVRLEFQGGVDLGHGLPAVSNLVVYMIKADSTIYRVTCTAPDGPFDNFCVGPFDDMVESFGLGPAPK